MTNTDSHVTIHMVASLDGFIARKDGSVDWLETSDEFVGGDTLDRSWKMLKPGGRIVTIAAENESTTDKRTKDAFFIVEPNANQLTQVAQLIDQGNLKTFMSVSLPLSPAPDAYLNRVPAASAFGKPVISIFTT